MRHVALAALAAASAAGAAACDPAPTVTVVRLDARPAVRDVERIELTFANASATLSHAFDVGGRAFPLTFSVETPGRTGALEVTARGLARGGALAALGATTSTIVPEDEVTAALMLEPADFLVNTRLDGAQRLSWLGPSAGWQVAADPDGTFTVGFTDDCGMLARCDVFGRRFDATARPVFTQRAASDAQFTVNVTDILGYDPSMATNPDGATLAAWTTIEDIVAIAIAPDGAIGAGGETVVSTGTATQPPAVAAMPDGRFAVAWIEADGGSGQDVVRGRFLDAAGRPIVNPQTGTTAPFTINTAAGVTPSQVAIAATGNGLELGIVWRVGSSLRGRFTSSGGTLVPTQELSFADFNTLDTLWAPRIVSTPDGRFVIAWGHRTGTGLLADGAIVSRKLAPPIGMQLGTDAYIALGMADTITGFGLARDGDGALAAVWQACGDLGDGSGCAVRMQVFRETGLRVGPQRIVNTTTAGHQFEPSIAALGGGAWAVVWTDDSRGEDSSLTGIRARVVYPPFLDATGVIGARCGGAGGATCDDGTACLAGTDGVPRCHEACDPGAPPPHCQGGGVCTDRGDVSGCVL